MSAPCPAPSSEAADARSFGIMSLAGVLMRSRTRATARASARAESAAPADPGNSRADGGVDFRYRPKR